MIYRAAMYLNTVYRIAMYLSRGARGTGSVLAYIVFVIFYKLLKNFTFLLKKQVV